jgi:hypothetical protein
LIQIKDAGFFFRHDPFQRREMMRKLFLLAAFIATSSVLTAFAPTFAQDAGGIAQCLAGCAKVDKACQDSCVPSHKIGARAHACLNNCRRNAKEPDLMVNLKACIGSCIPSAVPTQ